MRILLSAFQPFGSDLVNAAQIAVDGVAGHIGSHDITKVTVPVSFGRAPLVVEAAIDEVRPDAVVMVGQAPRRAVCLERVALNLMRAKNADNDGFRPIGLPVIADGPAAYFTAVDIDTIVERLQTRGMSVQVSNTAGLYVCNALYYNVLHSHQHTPVLFIHVPKADTLSAGEAAAIITAVISEL